MFVSNLVLRTTYIGSCVLCDSSKSSMRYESKYYTRMLCKEQILAHLDRHLEALFERNDTLHLSFGDVDTVYSMEVAWSDKFPKCYKYTIYSIWICNYARLLTMKAKVLCPEEIRAKVAELLSPLKEEVYTDTMSLIKILKKQDLVLECIKRVLGYVTKLPIRLPHCFDSIDHSSIDITTEQHIKFLKMAYALSSRDPSRLDISSDTKMMKEVYSALEILEEKSIAAFETFLEDEELDGPGRKYVTMRKRDREISYPLSPLPPRFDRAEQVLRHLEKMSVGLYKLGSPPKVISVRNFNSDSRVESSSVWFIPETLLVRSGAYYYAIGLRVALENVALFVAISVSSLVEEVPSCIKKLEESKLATKLTVHGVADLFCNTCVGKQPEYMALPFCSVSQPVSTYLYKKESWHYAETKNTDEFRYQLISNPKAYLNAVDSMDIAISAIELEEYLKNLPRQFSLGVVSDDGSTGYVIRRYEDVWSKHGKFVTMQASCSVAKDPNNKYSVVWKEQESISSGIIQSMLELYSTGKATLSATLSLSILSKRPEYKPEMRNRLLSRIHTEIITVLSKLVKDTGLTLEKIVRPWIREDAPTLCPENVALLCVFLHCMDIEIPVDTFCTIKNIDEAEEELKKRTHLIKGLVDNTI